jgi:small conductance mechanosensitive channel
MDWSKIEENIVTFLVNKGFDIVGAIIILVVGALLAGRVGRWVAHSLEKHRLEPPIRILLTRVVKLLIFLVAAVLALGQVGVPIEPLVAGLGVAGVGVGLAMQGVLGNFFAGLTIIFTKPFRVGEYIELLGVSGQVTQIELLSTRLLHTDKSLISIPNHKILGEILHNYGVIRQLTLNVGVGYGSDLPLVAATAKDVLARNPRVLKEHPAVVGITALGTSSINLCLQPWVSVEDFNPAQIELYEAIVAEFRSKKIEMPFPQHEVRLLNNSPAA